MPNLKIKKNFFFYVLNNIWTNKFTYKKELLFKSNSFFSSNRLKFFKILNDNINYKNFDHNLYNEILSQKFFFNKNLINNDLSNYLFLFSIKTSLRFYCNFGSTIKQFKNIWSSFIIGSYYGINIININKSFILLKILNIFFSKLFFKFVPSSKILIYSDQISKQKLFHLGCFLGQNYYLSDWFYGFLTNKAQWWRQPHFNKKTEIILFKPGGFPFLIFFTTFLTEYRAHCIINEFSKFKLPLFGICDTGYSSDNIFFKIPLNTKNFLSNYFYLMLISILLKKNLVKKKQLWKFKLNSLIFKFYIKKIKKIKSINALKKKKNLFKLTLKKFYKTQKKFRIKFVKK